MSTSDQSTPARRPLVPNNRARIAARSSTSAQAVIFRPFRVPSLGVPRQTPPKPSVPGPSNEYENEHECIDIDGNNDAVDDSKGVVPHAEWTYRDPAGDLELGCNARNWSAYRTPRPRPTARTETPEMTQSPASGNNGGIRNSNDTPVDQMAPKSKTDEEALDAEVEVTLGSETEGEVEHSPEAVEGGMIFATSTDGAGDVVVGTPTHKADGEDMASSDMEMGDEVVVSSEIESEDEDTVASLEDEDNSESSDVEMTDSVEVVSDEGREDCGSESDESDEEDMPEIRFVTMREPARACSAYAGRGISVPVKYRSGRAPGRSHV